LHQRTLSRLCNGINTGRTLNVNQSTISRLWNRFQQTGSTNDRQRSGRPRITTPWKDRYVRVFHLRNRTVAASTAAAEIPVNIQSSCYLILGLSGLETTDNDISLMKVIPEARHVH
jgi:hypothetical protein